MLFGAKEINPEIVTKKKPTIPYNVKPHLHSQYQYASRENHTKLKSCNILCGKKNEDKQPHT